MELMKRGKNEKCRSGKTKTTKTKIKAISVKKNLRVYYKVFVLIYNSKCMMNKRKE
jgi:hypothetical protein